MDAYQWPDGKLAVFLADINGDSLADLVVVGPRTVPGFQGAYWPGDGRGNFTACVGAGCTVTWTGSKVTSVPMVQAPLGPEVAPNRIQFGDLDGNGYDDMVTWAQDGIRIYLNFEGWAFNDPIFVSGNQITDGINGWGPDQDPDKVRVAFADMNGNGINDLLVIMGNRVWALDLERNTPEAGPFVADDDYAPRGGLLVEIDNGLGASTQVMYQSTADLYRASQRAGKSWPEPLPQVMMVVGRITAKANLPLPYRVRQPVSYSYSDPVWDGWERRFLGFREVVSSQGDPAFGPLEVVYTRNSYFIPVCPEGYCGSADASYAQQRIASGGPTITETFDSDGHYLSTVSRSYKVVESLRGLDGRVARFSYVSQVDTRLYDQRSWSAFDRATPFTVEGLEMKWTGMAPVRSRNNALIRQTQQLDANGRLIESIDYGRIKEDGGPIDDPIIRRVKVAALRDDWRFPVDSERIEPFPKRMQPPVPADVVRERRFDYDGAGRLTAIWAHLSGTLPLDRSSLGAPAPLSASKDGDIRIAKFEYDKYDNVTLTVSAAGACEQIVYEKDFAQYPSQRIALGGPGPGPFSGCGGIRQRMRLGWDRGLGAPITEATPQGATTVFRYDSFGRPTEVIDPDPLTGAPQDEPSIRIAYFTSPGGPVQRARMEQRTGPGQFRQAWGYTDGAGAPLLSLEQADPSAGDGGDWRVQGLARGNAQGLATDVFDPWFYSGDPANHPLAPPTSPMTRVQRNHFGQVISIRAPNGVVTRKFGYGALLLDIVDEDGQAEQLVSDGHFRPISTVRQDGAGNIVSRTYYQVMGEPALIVRSHSAAAGEVVRWMRYDSLGRMVMNAEPNTAANFSADPNAAPGPRSWRYAYDDGGHLVATSDARGCGKNMHYDRFGRVIAEDYSPCLAAQGPYTPYVPSTGDGAEILSRYDFAEPGQAEDFGVSTTNLMGRLVSRRDASGHMRFGYDMRGRLLSAAQN